MKRVFALLDELGHSPDAFLDWHIPIDARLLAGWHARLAYPHCAKVTTIAAAQHNGRSVTERAQRCTRVFAALASAP